MPLVESLSEVRMRDIYRMTINACGSITIHDTNASTSANMSVSSDFGSRP